MRWDPEQYDRYADERGRPYLDLLARVGATAPRRVVDLGCGPGTLTAVLAERWPDAFVEGIDSSEEMIAAASAVPGIHVRSQDVSTWQVPDDADVVISNATLQWVPGHQDLLSDWAAVVPADGWLAFQVPGNFDASSHSLMRSLAAEDKWAPQLDGVLSHQESVSSPVEYAALLLDHGLDVDVWETTYLHMLPGRDPVLEWLRGTALRPVLAALSDADGRTFCSEFAQRLRVAYPATQHGTPMPFRRIFAVGHRAS